MKRLSLLAILLVLLIGAAVVTAQETSGGSYIVVTTDIGTVSQGMVQNIEAAGATVTSTMNRVGMVAVEGGDPALLERLPGVQSVIPNIPVRNIEPGRIVNVTEADLAAVADAINPPFDPGFYDTFYNLQWYLDAVNAPEAWDRGITGNGVIIAILDEGIDAEHADIAPNLRADLSASFVPGEDWNVLPGFFFNHGTHVAGIAAGAAGTAFPSGNTGIIGVAPNAEIMAVKVLSEFTGSGQTDWIIAGIEHAVDNGADIINMSLGTAPLDQNGGCLAPPDDDVCYTAEDVTEIRVAYDRVMAYANANGVLVFASAGNDGFDFDANPSFVKFPADAIHIQQVSALGPLAWLLQHINGVPRLDIDLDIPTSYTNYGRRVIDFSAPGGNFDYPGTELCSFFGVRDCWIFDMSFSAISDGWSWAAGTSMASPVAAGIAALIMEETGNRNPNFVVREMRRRGDDLGPLGPDAFFGDVRVSTGFPDTDFVAPEVPFCDGKPATIYVANGKIVGGPQNGQNYNGTLNGTNNNDVMVGTEGRDVIRGSNGNDTICALGGNDVVRGGEHDDRLFGGFGADDINGENGRDLIQGDDGNDTLRGGEHEDEIYGSHGADMIYGDNGHDVLFGDEGNDQIWGSHGDDMINGGEGADQLWGGEGRDTIEGWKGNDTIRGEGGQDKLYGGNIGTPINSGRDTIYGGNEGDEIWGGDVGDKLYGEQGNDTIYGEDGNDDIWAADGEDKVYAGRGADEVWLGQGQDYAEGGLGPDTIYGDSGDDRIYGQEGNDFLFGGDNNDTLDGGPNTDTCDGGNGYDNGTCEVVNSIP